MRVTSEIKEYIRVEVEKKAELRLQALRNERDAIIKSADDRYDTVVKEIGELLKPLQAKANAIIKKAGLTKRYDNDAIKLDINKDSFNETYNTYCNGGRSYVLNKGVRQLDKSIEQLKSDINHMTQGVIFKLEAGGKASDIEAMIASIKF